MSKIEKLSITGIRSFGPGDRQTIQFDTPLTLIVGYNGSGKTTVIECLKYATTGELPPNSKGGAFVHDPKLCGESEVRASVKLKFVQPPKICHVVSRMVQLTVQKSKRTQKTLEGSLLTIREGERNQQSSKNVELDSKVPECLGVAPAILDAVIFCHQDESLWPMSEPSALKKRFDEIFQAQKYTKATDNLKQLRKKYTIELKGLKIAEGFEKENRDKGDRCEKRAVALQGEIEAMRANIHGMVAQHGEAARKVREKRELQATFYKVLQDIKSKTDNLGIYRENVDQLKAHIDELEDSDEMLKSHLAQHEDRVKRYEAEHGETTLQYAEYQKEQASTRRQLETKLAERGRHQSDKDKYERQLKARAVQIQKAADLHGIRGFDGDLDARQIKQFQDRVNKLLADKKKELDNLHKLNAEEDDRKTTVVHELESKKQSSTQDRHSARQRIGALEKRINNSQNELNNLDIDEGAKVLLESQFQDLSEQIRKVQTELQAAGLDSKLRQEQTELTRLENESEALSEEMVEASKSAAARARLDVRKQELAVKKRNLENLTHTWTERLTDMLAGPWKPTTLEQQFQTVLQAKSKALADEERKRSEVQQSLKQVQFTLASARDKAKKREQELDRCKTSVQKALDEVKSGCHVDDLSNEIEILEEDILSYEKDIALFHSLKEYYTKCQKKLKKDNRCLLCEHVFSTESEKSKIVQTIRKGLDDQSQEQTKSDLDVAEEHLGKLRAVRPLYESYVRLSQEKPEAEDEIQSLKDKHESFVRELESMDEVVRERREEKQDIESMSKTVLSIAQMYREVLDGEAEVERSQTQQVSAGSRSSDTIQELQAACTEAMRGVKAKINKYQADRQRLRDLATSLELERSELNTKISRAGQELERKKDIQKHIQNFKDDMNQQKEIIQQADRDLEAVAPDIAKARAVREDVLQRGRARVKEKADERDELAATVNGLRATESELQAYLDRGGPASLAANERAIKALEQTTSSLEKDMNELGAKINKLKEEINDSGRKKKNIRDNLNYRATLRQVADIEREIDMLSSRDAEADYRRLEEEVIAAERLRDKLNAECSKMTGAMSSKDQELSGFIAQWETEYKDAAQQYRETHIKAETTKAAIDDLAVFGAALDKAIMAYHSHKMEEINRIAGDLWQSTYQGTDIDTILIRSENEEGATAGAGRRSYNYRVCMVKSDTEMDMRGRCSAGQRVLASIIIRLALAESFGTNCGLIALDEPTTNLDRDNIKSLAESLHRIIKARQSQSNFQLIIITHDEEFLRHMQCSDFCEYFWRVKRDDKQNSVITKESIMTVSN